MKYLYLIFCTPFGILFTVAVIFLWLRAEFKDNQKKERLILGLLSFVSLFLVIQGYTDMNRSFERMYVSRSLQSIKAHIQKGNSSPVITAIDTFEQTKNQAKGFGAYSSLYINLSEGQLGNDGQK